MMKPFNLFERVASNDVSSLVLIPIDQMFDNPKSMKAVQQSWAAVVKSKSPQTFCYAIFDKIASVPFTGLKQNNFYLNNTVILRQRFMCNRLFTPRRPREPSRL